jgi:hypothetical protein
MTAPEASTTVPVIEPAACWLHAMDDAPEIRIRLQATPTAICNIRFIRFTEIPPIQVQVECWAFLNSYSDVVNNYIAVEFLQVKKKSSGIWNCFPSFCGKRTPLYIESAT